MKKLFSKEILPLRNLASGHELTIQVFRFHGSEPSALTTYIQASLHGSEVQGNMLIYQLMNYFHQYPPLGDIILVPMANPYGSNFKIGEYTLGRFDPGTGFNWNRSFWDATCRDEESRKDLYQLNLQEFVQKNLNHDESAIKKQFKKILKDHLQKKLNNSHVPGSGLDFSQKMALVLHSIASEADIILDFHTGPYSTEYLYVPDYCLTSAKFLNFPHTLLVAPSFDGAFDEANFMSWYKLQQSFHQQGRTNLPEGFGVDSITVELGSQERIDSQRAQTQLSNLLNYLAHKKVIEQPPSSFRPTSIKQYSCALKNYQGQYAPQGGLIEMKVKPGDQFKKGDVLAHLLNFHQIDCLYKIKKGLIPIIANEDGIVINHTPSACVHEGAEILRYMSKYKMI